MRGRSRRRRGGLRRGGRRGLRLTVWAVVLTVVAVVGSWLAAAGLLLARVDRVDVGGLAADPEGTRNVLLVGSDSREGLTEQQRAELSTGFEPGERADSILLLSVHDGRPALLAFPRDLHVTRCDGSQGRINGALAIGDGPDCLAQTVRDVSGLPVTHYAEVDMAGFVELVDAVGGVSVWLGEPIADDDAGIDLPAGCNRLDAADALGFVRVRGVDSDLGRIARQQRFVRQLAGEVAAPSTLLRPDRVVGLAAGAADAGRVDRGLGASDLAALAPSGWAMARHGAPAEMVPASPATIGGAAVLVADQPAADQLYAAFADGTVHRDHAAADQPPDEPDEQPAGPEQADPEPDEADQQPRVPAHEAWDGPVGAGPVPPDC